MDYDDVVTALFAPAPADQPEPPPVAEAGDARRLRDAFEPLSMHAVWSPLVHQRMSAKGLDFFMTYVWGRACVMGQPNGAVVASAFAAFEPSMIAGVYDQARAAMAHDDALRLTVDSTAESLRSVLGNVDESAIANTGDRLADVVDSLDPTGRPLFSGVASLPRPSDPYACLWQSCLALREHRGDAHVAAYLSAGFSPIEMNILTELWLGYPLGEYSGTRAWPEPSTAAALNSLATTGYISGDALTAKGREARDAIEAKTDDMEQSVLDAIGGDLNDVTAQLTEWSQHCIDAGMFPPDPRKRAAG